MGHADYLKFDGDWNAICDRCGFKHKASALKEEWTGWMVCSGCWEPRHPQDYLRGIPDDSSVPWARPDDNEQATITYGDISTRLDGDDALDIHIWNTDLTEDRVVQLQTTNSNKGDRITVYKTIDDGKTLYITSEVLDAGTSV